MSNQKYFISLICLCSILLPLSAKNFTPDPLSPITDKKKSLCRHQIYEPNQEIDQEKSSNSTSRAKISPPKNVVLVNEGVRSMGLKFEQSADWDLTKSYSYAFGGIDPKHPKYPAELKTWTVCSKEQNFIYGHSLQDLRDMCKAANLPELKVGDSFLISIYAKPTTTSYSNSDTIKVKATIKNQELGLSTNKITIAFGNKIGTEVWTDSEKSVINNFLTKMLPIIEEFYGAPALNNTVTLTKDKTQNFANVYMADPNQVWMYAFNPQLLTHELIHSWRDYTCLSTSAKWHFDFPFMGFEESFAQGVSYQCMNEYAIRYPNDAIYNGELPFNYRPDYEFNYDFVNTDILTTTDFWSAGNSDATHIGWTRYEMGAAIIMKILVEDKFFAKKFNQEYYKRLNQNINYIVTREEMINIFETVLASNGGKIEGKPVSKWIDQQRIYDCQLKEGFKIFVNQEIYPSWLDYIIYNKVFYYKTFPNASEWSYKPNDQWQLHSHNGASGTYNIYDYQGSKINGKSILTQPTAQPDINNPNGEGFKFASAQVDLTSLTQQDFVSQAGGEAENWFKFTGEGVFCEEINLKTADGSAVTRSNYIVNGDFLDNFSGVYGAVVYDPNGVNKSNKDGYRNGTIYLKHENHPEISLPVINGLFYGKTAWTGKEIENPYYKISEKGKVFIKFKDDNGKTYYDQRNINIGNDFGSQLFLLRVQNMSQESDITQITEQNINLLSNYPNPFNPTTNINFSINQAAKINISIYNAKGELVKELLNEEKNRGQHSIAFDGSNLNSGIYFAVIKGAKETMVNKMILLK